MEEIKLDVQIREQLGSRKATAMRREDFVPGIVYGGNKKPTSIKIERRPYEKIRRQHLGESLVFHLTVFDGEKKLRDYSAIIKEEQHDAVTDKILHIDFKRISLKQAIEVKVPVQSKGEAAGVKNDGGSLDHLLWELDVVCLPTVIPQHIDVDVSGLGIGDAIHVKDIVLPEGVTTKHDPDAIVFSVVPPMKDEEEAAEGEEGLEEPELVKEKKEEAPAAQQEEPSE